MDWNGINQLQGLAKTAAATRQAEQLHKTDLEAVRILNDPTIPDKNKRYEMARDHIAKSLMPKELKGGIFANLARTVSPPPNAMSEFQRGIFSQARSGVLPSKDETGTFETPDESTARGYGEAQRKYMEGTGRQTYRRSPTADIADLEGARATLWETLKRAGVENPDENPRIKAYDRRIERMLGDGDIQDEPQVEPQASPVRDQARANVVYGSPGVPPGTGAGVLGGVGSVVAGMPAETPQTSVPQSAPMASEAPVSRAVNVSDYIARAREMGADETDLADLQAIFAGGDEAVIQEAIRRLTPQGK